MKVPESTKIIGIVCLILGVLIRFAIGRRKFNRRNVAGLETFSSSSSSLGNRFLDGLGKLIGLILILIGIVVLVMIFR